MDGWMDRLICRLNSFDPFRYDFFSALVFVFVHVFVYLFSEQHVLLHKLHGNDVIHTAPPGGESRTEPYRCGGDNHRVSVYSEFPSPRVNHRVIYKMSLVLTRPVPSTAYTRRLLTSPSIKHGLKHRIYLGYIYLSSTSKKWKTYCFHYQQLVLNF